MKVHQAKVTKEVQTIRLGLGDQIKVIISFIGLESRKMGNCESQSILQHTHVPVLGRLGPVTDLRIVNSMWLRDYQGLFDYETKEVKRQVINLAQSGFLVKEGQEKVVRNLKQSQVTEAKMKNALFEVHKTSNYYKIMPIAFENEQYTIQKLLWLVIRTVPNQRYPLKEKDVLKLGKERIKVREIVLYDNNSQVMTDAKNIRTSKKIYEDIRYHEQQPANSLNLKQQHHNEVISIATENQPSCRVCLEPGELNNPLICACKCSGSVRYIHLTCLRTWLGKQLKISKTQHCISIKWTPLSCEMCKSHYKYRIYLDNKKHYTVQIPKPAKPYIVLEVIKKKAEYSKIFHFVSMSQTSKLTIGRKKEIDIKLSEDVSVSRHHANLIYDFEGKRFLIEDNKSKFGTLVQVRKNMLVNPFHRGITVQLGGELYTFETGRGQGSIPEYYDEPGYLNVVERGEKNVDQDEESDQNNDDDDYDGEEDDPQAGQAPPGIMLNNSQANSMPRIPGAPAQQPQLLEQLPVQNAPAINILPPQNVNSVSLAVSYVPQPQPQPQPQPLSQPQIVPPPIEIQNLDY